jgi:predicted TPR repeat methyltransferase
LKYIDLPEVNLYYLGDNFGALVAIKQLMDPYEVFDKYAQQYKDKFMNLELYHDSFDTFCENLIKENSEILDIACGPGNITNYLLTRRPDFKITGIDLSQNMIDLAKANNPSAIFELKDMKEISSIKSTFDGIVCGFGLPYLNRVEAMKLIADASQLLNKAGILYLSTMEDDYSKSGYRIASTGDKLYIHCHEEDYLVKAMKDNGFQITEMQRKSYPEDDGSITVDLILIGIKD